MNGYPNPQGQDHEDFEGLAAGYALHALEPHDEQRLAAHLLTCPSCARLVADTAAIGVAFAGLLAPVDPPPAGLRARIMAAAAAEPRQPLEAQSPEAQSPEARSEADQVMPAAPAPTARRREPVARGTDVGGTAARRARLRRMRVRSRVAVGVLAAIVGIGVAVPVTLAASGHKATTNNNALAQWMVQSREVTLRGTGASVAKAFVSDKGVYLVASGLPVNDARRSLYVLWAANTHGVRTAVATFDVRSGSPVQFAALKSMNPAEISQIAVSYEPGRKAPAAPSDVVLSGSAA